MKNLEDRTRGIKRVTDTDSVFCVPGSVEQQPSLPSQFQVFSCKYFQGKHLGHKHWHGRTNRW